MLLKTKTAIAASLGLLVLSVGCGSPASTVSQDDSAAPGTDVASSQYVAENEPPGAVPVGDAKESVKDDQDVVLVGVIGGSREPFVDGIAAFTIVDPKVPYCGDNEGCPTPWDYCCEQDQVRDNIATVKVVDENGDPVASDARDLLNIEELSTVVVKGAAQRDADGNLSVLASQVFVRPTP